MFVQTINILLNVRTNALRFPNDHWGTDEKGALLPSAPWQISVLVASFTMNFGLETNSCARQLKKQLLKEYYLFNYWTERVRAQMPNAQDIIQWLEQVTG